MAPYRTCIGCRRVAPAGELVRIVAGPGGVRPGRGQPGRGAWLCAGSAACVDAARRRQAFVRALRTEVTTKEAAALREAVAGRGRIEGDGAGPNASGGQEKEI